MLSVFSQKPNVLIMDEPSVDCDLDTLGALERYLTEFDGVLILVSHDRAFADKVTDHLFIFEGDGEIKDFSGTLSEYAATLVELENDRIPSEKSTEDSVEDQKASRAKRNEERNAVRKAKKDMINLERKIENLKKDAAEIQAKIDSSTDEGWTVLAQLTDKLNAINADVDEREMEWMELAELVEQSEVEV